MADRAFEEVVADLTRIVETSRAERSALGLFPAMYRTVTVTVGEGADAGVFEDPERVRRLVAVFADRYVDAYDTHRSGGDAPLAWALAFQLADRGRGSICEHLLLGMNAHINLDLGVAAAEVSTPEDHAALRADFDRVNAVLFGLVDVLQGAMGSVSPWMARLDRMGLGFDEALMRMGIGAARGQAWGFSERLVAAEVGARPGLIADQDVDARRAGRLLCTGWSPLHLANRVVAMRESRDRHQVIDALGSARIDVRTLLA
ncbi:MAG: DUF5995 family protein [Acidimicrobiales bacterium]